MNKRAAQKPTDKVRASRDGHEFHEAWVARKALELVVPRDSLCGIAVEGLSPADQASASSATTEIADVTLYYGTSPTLRDAESISIVQVKYSKRSASRPFRAADATKTVAKFAATYKSLNKPPGKPARNRLTFELVTNRPVHKGLLLALEAIESRSPTTGDVKQQVSQLTAASGLSGDDLADFAKKVQLTGLAGSLAQNKLQVSRVLADWSAARDTLSRARLGNLKQLVRDKAGLAGEGRNIIARVDVLAALEVSEPADLFPCPASFPEIGPVVERDQLVSVAALIPGLQQPLVIHADGGGGKTVFLQSLARILGKQHHTVVFDCFGGGAYRAPDDARHLPKRGLIHIANKLAGEGLCDPLLPESEHTEELVKGFRSRLAQAVETLRRWSSDTQLLLFIDAVDNAAEEAKERGEPSFPRLLLESFTFKGAVSRVQLVMSCRTYRRSIATGGLPCQQVRLEPFSIRETEQYLRARISTVTATEIQVAFSRSLGNPRVLEHLALGDRGLLDASEVNQVIHLDDLLKARIEKALEEASRRGYTSESIDAFLAGLAVLPPPVPLDEYAHAHQMDVSAVKSFAADLAPLVEQTRHGVMFRDEPTETFVRARYATNTDALRRVATNLLTKQDSSVYAATALPTLLQILEDGQKLFDLAFDSRFPAAITSTVGNQNIRYARLKAAVLYSARNLEYDRLVHLLLELTTLAAINQRGTAHVIGNPDLVIASADVDAIRRLFEARTAWPGKRHARLAIASVLSGDLANAFRHAVGAYEWMQHFYAQDDEYRQRNPGPDKLDVAAIPVCLTAQNRGRDAARELARWRDWYAFEVSEHVFGLLRQAETLESISRQNVLAFLKSLKSQPGVVAGALSFCEFSARTRRALVVSLAKACEHKRINEKSDPFYRDRGRTIEDGILKSAAIALSLRMREESMTILSALDVDRPRLWSLSDRASYEAVVPFITCTALQFAARGMAVTPDSLLPSELFVLLPKDSVVDAENCRATIAAKLEEYFESQRVLPEERRAMSYETKQDAQRFLSARLDALVEITTTLARVARAPINQSDSAFLELMQIWEKLRCREEHFAYRDGTNHFFDSLGRRLVVFALWARSDLSAATVKVLVDKVVSDGMAQAQTLIEITSILAERPQLHGLAGMTARKAAQLIEFEDDVGHRASLYSRLARAILTASSTEAAAYFRTSIEHMDAIGSGDYGLVNELLQFAAGLRGPELNEAEFHALANICELNLSGDAEKFPWAVFGQAMSSTSGSRGLAKLARWADRDKVSLDYTLLPYLQALLQQDKIKPDVALGLLRLSSPVELHTCGTTQLAETIASKHYDGQALLSELIRQFDENTIGLWRASTLLTLQRLAESAFGVSEEQSVYLSMLVPRLTALREESYRNQDSQSRTAGKWKRKAKQEENNKRQMLLKIADETDPGDEAALARAIQSMNELKPLFECDTEFFASLRAKVSFAGRPDYIRAIALLAHLDIYHKLAELKALKQAWTTSSVALDSVFRSIATPVIELHAADFIYYEHFSTSELKELADLSGRGIAELVLEFLRVFSVPKTDIPASVWLAFATLLLDKTTDGEGQAALKRLLTSTSAKLAESVADGPWRAGLYSPSDEIDITAGLVWKTLGSPWAAERWRAAHSIRAFGRLGKWDIIDAIVNRMDTTEAGPYQAPELSFFFEHAKLWTLIAIARLAVDYPERIARYADVLKRIANDANVPHVLFRLFAARTLLACFHSGNLILSDAYARTLTRINESPFPLKETGEHRNDSLYGPRPSTMPAPKTEFHLDYDFDKLEVSEVSDIFDRLRWETRDTITFWVRKYDSNVSSMYDDGGHRRPDRNAHGMTDWYQSYGQQLGLHGLYLTAGEFLSKYPVVKHPYGYDDPWHRWLSDAELTRKDGLWLADGVDPTPIDTHANLFERKKGKLALTGEPKKILALLRIESESVTDLVVAGHWDSDDGVAVSISSALISSHDATAEVKRLLREDPFQAWLPHAEEYDHADQPGYHKETPFKPWIYWPAVETKLDKTDPLATASAAKRRSFVKAINEVRSLSASDPFARRWLDQSGEEIVRSEVWSRNRSRSEAGPSSERMVCHSAFLREVLEAQQSDLVLFVRLRRYERGYGTEGAKYWHTTAVIHVDQSLNWQYYAGVVNKLHKIKY